MPARAEPKGFSGTGRIGDAFEMTLDGRGPVHALSPFLPMEGEGDFRIQGLSLRLAREGPIHLDGILTAAELLPIEI